MHIRFEWTILKKEALFRLMNEQQNLAFAENLNRLLKEKGWSINSAAKKVGMSKSTLHNYCCGVFPRNLQSLKDLADLFGISLNELIIGERQATDYVSQEFSIEGTYEIIIRRKKRESLPTGVTE